MENLKYYLDLDNGFLLAHEKTTEFFVRYIREIGEWEPLMISFSNFKHDYNFKEISKEEALQKSDGCLPEAMFQTYSDTIKTNRGL